MITTAHHMTLVSLTPISLVCISGLFQEINEVRCTIDIFKSYRVAVLLSEDVKINKTLFWRGGVFEYHITATLVELGKVLFERKIGLAKESILTLHSKSFSFQNLFLLRNLR